MTKPQQLGELVDRAERVLVTDDPALADQPRDQLRRQIAAETMQHLREAGLLEELPAAQIDDSVTPSLPLPGDWFRMVHCYRSRRSRALIERPCGSQRWHSLAGEAERYDHHMRLCKPDCCYHEGWLLTAACGWSEEVWDQRPQHDNLVYAKWSSEPLLRPASDACGSWDRRQVETALLRRLVSA